MNSAIPAEPGSPCAANDKVRRSGFGRTAMVLLAGAAVGGALSWRPGPLLVWNASASSPMGLYRVTSARVAVRGDVVVAWAPHWARLLAADRGYLPATVPLVKIVAAVAGDSICAAENDILINGRKVALRRLRDSNGRPMPRWFGCRRLGSGELFLLSAGVPQAFDGRYFGVTRGAEVVGTAKLLWAKPVKGIADG